MRHLFVGTVGIIMTYFALTWFFFGSPHPCGILEARQRPYVIQRARDNTSEDRRLALELIKTMKPDALDAGTSLLQTAHEVIGQAPNNLKKRVALLTPSECAWQAITWTPPKVERYRPLREGEEVLALVEPNVPGATEK